MTVALVLIIVLLIHLNQILVFYGEEYGFCPPSSPIIAASHLMAVIVSRDRISLCHSKTAH